MSNGVTTSLTGWLVSPAELKRSRFGKSYLLFSLAVDPDSAGVMAPIDGKPAEVRVQLYGDHVGELAEQLHQNVRVSITGWLELQSRAGDAAKGARLGMAAMSCTVLGDPIDQGEVS